MPANQVKLPDGSRILLREATGKDASALLTYVKSISGETDFLSFGPGEFEFTEAKEKDLIRKYRESETQLYLVGLIENQIVSTLTFSAGHRPRTRHCGEFGISVQKEHWGHGIGSLMLDTLIEWVTKKELKKLNLRVRTDNQRAIALYKRKGFLIEGSISRAIRIDGEYYDHYWMGLEL